MAGALHGDLSSLRVLFVVNVGSVVHARLRGFIFAVLRTKRRFLALRGRSRNNAGVTTLGRGDLIR